MKQILRFFLCMCLVVTSAQAMPPRGQFPIVRQQPDGTKIILLRHASCNGVVYTTQDGKAVSLAADGSYRYLVAAEDGLRLSEMLAHEASQRTGVEADFVKLNALSTREILDFNVEHKAPALRSQALNDDGLGTYGQSALGAVNSIGVHRIPVLMVEFPDVSFQDYTTAEKIQRQLTEQGYKDEPMAKGSARDYFLKQSQGMFDPQFEVLGRVKVSKNRAYYGQNTSTSSNKNINQFVKEAIDSALVHGIDLSPYVDPSTNGVPLVSLIYAGRGEATSFETGCEDFIWPHFKTLSYTPKGKSYNVRSYFVGNELMCNYEGVYDDTGKLIDIVPIENTDHMMGIGIFIHEFGHALGLPDFYCTTYSHTETGMGGLSVMDYGGYLFDTYCPLGYNAYERNFVGWLKLTELTEPGNYNLYAFDDENAGPTAYIIRNDNNQKEYFILENRQPTDYTPKAYGTGLFVVHADYDASAWRLNNLNNDPTHLRMTYIPADNGKEYNYDSAPAEFRGSFYPYKQTVTDGQGNPITDGQGNPIVILNDSLTQNSVPNDMVYTGEHMNKPIYNITVSEEGVVNFDFIKRSDSEPTALQTITASKPRRDQIFDLQGRRISKMQRGVYIKNGKKVIK